MVTFGVPGEPWQNITCKTTIFTKNLQIKGPNAYFKPENHVDTNNNIKMASINKIDEHGM